MKRELTEDEQVRRFEPLVRTTARQLARGDHPTMAGMPPIEIEEDDIAQLLFMKVLYAVRKWDPQRSAGAKNGKDPLQRWVFSCVYDCCKDIARKRRRFDMMLEDLTDEVCVGKGKDLVDRDITQGQFLSEERAFESDEPTDLLDTLPEREREVARLLYLGYSQTEITQQLNLSKRETAGLVKSVRLSLADLRSDVLSSS